jgi:hypothetical protein
MKKRKITKKELAEKVFARILENKSAGFWSFVLNSDGSFDTNRTVRFVKAEILAEHSIDVKSTTLQRYLRDYKRIA